MRRFYMILSYKGLFRFTEFDVILSSGPLNGCERFFQISISERCAQKSLSKFSPVLRDRCKWPTIWRLKWTLSRLLWQGQNKKRLSDTLDKLICVVSCAVYCGKTDFCGNYSANTLTIPWGFVEGNFINFKNIR